MRKSSNGKSGAGNVEDYKVMADKVMTEEGWYRCVNCDAIHIYKIKDVLRGIKCYNCDKTGELHPTEPPAQTGPINDRRTTDQPSDRRMPGEVYEFTVLATGDNKVNIQCDFNCLECMVRSPKFVILRNSGGEIMKTKDIESLQHIISNEELEKPDVMTFGKPDPPDTQTSALIDAATIGYNVVSSADSDNLPDDPWIHRSSDMRCRTCAFYVQKGQTGEIGRCRRRCPTMSGYPMVYETDWCGDHKLDETKVGA